jgi:hypothetical protein
MARRTRGVSLGPRSRVDPAGRANRRPFGGTNRRPRTEVPGSGAARARMAKNCSPHAYGQRHRRSRRGAGRGGRY